VLPLSAAAVSVLLPLPPGRAARSRTISYSFDFKLSSKNLSEGHVGPTSIKMLRERMAVCHLRER